MKKLLLSALFVSFAFVACTDDDIRADHEFTSSPNIVGFAKELEAVSYFADEGQIEKEFPVNLLGGGNGQVLDTPIEVSYSIDTANSTAVEGVEFNFADASGKVIIPAGQTFGMFPLLINTGNFNPTQKTELVLNLTTANNGAVVSSTGKTLSIVFIGCQSEVATTASNLYTVVVTRNDGIVRTYLNEAISTVSVNYFKSSTTGQWAAGTIAPDQGYNFTDICGDITIENQNLAQGFYSNTVTGLNAYNGNDGVVTSGNSFTTNYEISFAAGPRQYTNVYTRNN